MEKKRRFIALSLIVSLITAVVFAVIAFAADVSRMTKEELKAQLGNPDVMVLDVRRGGDWTNSYHKIKGAVREDPNQVPSWAAHYSKDKTIVLYCAWHSEGTSASVALKLIEMGFTKVYALKGGWNEWEKAGYPVEKK